MFEGNNPKDLEALYSDRFYVDGVGKEVRLTKLYLLQRRATKVAIKPQSFEKTAKGISYRARMETNVGNFDAVGFIARENDSWVLLGSPNGKPENIVLPQDVKSFISSFSSALKSGSPKIFANSIAVSYLTNGLSKSDLVKFVTPYLSHLKPMEIIVSRFDRKDNRAIIDGVVIYETFGAVPLSPLYSSMIKSEGKWRWYGNQIPE